MEEAERIRQLKILIEEQRRDDKSRKVFRGHHNETTLDPDLVDRANFRPPDDEFGIPREIPDPRVNKKEVEE